MPRAFRWPWRGAAAPIESEAPELDALMRAAAAVRSDRDRVEWIRAALLWIEKDLNAADDEEGLGRALARVRFLVQLVERGTEAGAPVRSVLTGVVRALDLEQLTAAVGIPRRGGFLKEAYECVLNVLLPAPDVHHDAAALTSELLGSPTTLAWLDRLPDEDAARLGRLFTDEQTAAQTRPQIAAAMLTMASEAQAAGLATDLRSRFSNTSAIDSPFGRLVSATEAFLASPDETYRDELAATISDCATLLGTLHDHLAETGVSVDLFYRSERTREQLRKLARVAEYMYAPQPHRILRAVTGSVRREHQLRGVRALWRENMRLLSRRIAERNAEAGEHYIAVNRAQYRRMLAISAGGALMTIAVYAKFAIVAAHLPPFWEGMAASLNYAVVFVLVALAHFTVATKQPAMTAPALAAGMHDLESPGRLDALVDEAAALVRSQVASVFGNLAAVVPCVVAVALLFWLSFGQAPLGEAKARAVLASHSVLGPSFLFAMYTGVLLWLSGLFSGWADNAFTLRRMHAAIASNRRLVRRLGEAGARRRADWWQHNVAGLAGNIGLGVLLGLTPEIFEFFGLPIEVRRVTLSTGQLAAASYTLGFEGITTRPFWMAIAGVVLIGVLNVGVSFGLALRVAMRAVDISGSERARVYRGIRRALLTYTARLLWLPRDAASASGPTLGQAHG